LRTNTGILDEFCHNEVTSVYSLPGNKSRLLPSGSREWSHLDHRTGPNTLDLVPLPISPAIERRLAEANYPSCTKLLGASRSRVGQVVDCPRCRAEITIPSPEASGSGTPTSRSGEVYAASTMERAPSTTVAATAQPGVMPPPAFQPYFPEIQLGDDTLSLRGGSSEQSVRVPDRGVASQVDFHAPLPKTQELEALPGLKPVQPQPRRSDVVLPRTAVILWSFIVLMSISFAFLAGFLAGRAIPR
jgi:hypothetical protein